MKKHWYVIVLVAFIVLVSSCVIQIPFPPEPPSNLEAQVLSSTEIKLTWQDNSTNEEGFEIERKTEVEEWSQIKAVEADITEYTDSGLSTDTTYYYRVRAYNSAGKSNYSNEASATTSFVPSPKPEWLGNPECIPDIIFTKESTDVRFHILVNKEPDDLASESPVKLFMKDESNSWILLGEMFDDGDLDNHGDEIKGDRVYSNIIEFNEENVKEIPLKIVVTTSDNQQYSVEFSLSVFEDMTEKIIKDTEELSKLAEQKVSEIMQSPPSDLSSVVQILSDYLAKQSYVENCEIFGNIIRVTFDTGVSMEIQLINLDEEEPFEGANIAENLKLSSTTNREEEYISIPLENQTTGGDGFTDSLSKDTGYYLESIYGSEIEYIGNWDVFVFDPFYTYHKKWGHDVGNTYEELLDIGNSGIEFNIDIYRDHEADIEILKTISDYGIVIIHTHGSGKSFATGLEATEANIKKYKNEIYEKKVYISKSLGVSWESPDSVKVYEDKLGVKISWFNSTNFPEKLPNSIIFNNSCHNGNVDFYNSFKSIGAATYYGHSEETTRSYAIECTTKVLEGLLDGKTTEEAYVPNSNFLMFGKDNVKIPTFISFSNGGFESDLLNWKVEGDGRIIAALSFLNPTEGDKMAIISTGLGYTDKYGSISQTFTVGTEDTTLQFDWNYLSEELLEWIGSIYQDPFKVTITKTTDTSSKTLLYESVDSIATEFGATKESGGNLVYVSPDIVFDQGDVWMTDWQTFQCDISEFQGSKVTIKFEAVDEGDEILDTVILLDNIGIY